MLLLWDIMTRIVFKMVRNLVGCQQCQFLPCSSNKSNLTNTHWWRDFVQSGERYFEECFYSLLYVWDGNILYCASLAFDVWIEIWLDHFIFVLSPDHVTLQLTVFKCGSAISSQIQATTNKWENSTNKSKTTSSEFCPPTTSRASRGQTPAWANLLGLPGRVSHSYVLFLQCTGCPKKNPITIFFLFWTLFWPSFELLMTLTPN